MSAYERLEEEFEQFGLGNRVEFSSNNSSTSASICQQETDKQNQHDQSPGQSLTSCETRQVSLLDADTDQVDGTSTTSTTTSMHTTNMDMMDDYLLKTLDEMEKKTEKLRETVREAETERLFLLESLNMLTQSQALINITEGERNEVELYMDRLTSRLLTIDISVQIIRTPSQEESLVIVRALLRKLRDNIRQRDTAGQTVLRSYLNSCMAEASGPVDNRFQGALLGCTLEDQKEIKKKLVAMWEAKQDVDRQICILASIDLT